MASLTELSFNWTGFISAMISNISFTYRSIYSKKAMVMFLLSLDWSHWTILRNWDLAGPNYIASWHFFIILQTDMDSTNVYAYISIIALIVCIPPAIIVSTCVGRDVVIPSYEPWNSYHSLFDYSSRGLHWWRVVSKMQWQKLVLSSLCQIFSGSECFTTCTIR